MSFPFFEKAKNVGRSDDAYRNKKEDGLRKKYHNQTQRTTNKMKISQTKIFGCEKLSPAKKFARHGFLKRFGRLIQSLMLTQSSMSFSFRI